MPVIATSWVLTGTVCVSDAVRPSVVVMSSFALYEPSAAKRWPKPESVDVKPSPSVQLRDAMPAMS